MDSVPLLCLCLYKCTQHLTVENIHYLHEAVTDKQKTNAPFAEVCIICIGCVSQVVFSAAQLAWLSAEQAWAVTEEQWAQLNTDQRHAVGLARYEGDVLYEIRGVMVKESHFNKMLHKTTPM